MAALAPPPLPPVTRLMKPRRCHAGANDGTISGASLRHQRRQPASSNLG